MKKTVCLFLALFLGLSCAAGAFAESGSFEKVGQDQAEERIQGMMEGEFTTAEMASRSVTDDIAATADLVWQVHGQRVRCADPVSDSTAAASSLSEILAGWLTEEAAEDLTFLHLLSWSADSVLLYIPLELENSVRVLLCELVRDGETVRARNILDVSDVLGGYYGENSSYLEVDPVNCDGGLYIAALTRDYVFHFSWFDLEARTLTEVGEQRLMFYYASVPYNGHILMAGSSSEEAGTLELTEITLPGGERTLLSSVPRDSGSIAVNYAWSPEEQLLCFTVGGTAYRVTPGSGTEAVPFAVLDAEPMANRTGVLCGGRYVVPNARGRLVSLDPRAELTETRLRVANLAAAEDLGEAALSFHAERPDLLVQVSEGGDDSGVLDAMLNQSAEVDLYVTSTDTSVWQALLERGYLGSMTGSTELEEAAADMSESVRAQIFRGSDLMAIPLGTENECLTLNAAALWVLTGIDPDAVPTDWAGFLGLLADLADYGVLRDNREFTLYEGGMPARQFRQQVFTWIMRDVWLWLSVDETRLSRLQETLSPVLRAFEAVDWDGLGFDGEAQGQDITWFLTHERTPLLQESMIEVAAGMDTGLRFWPLSLEPEGERLIPRTLTVLWINPWSPRHEEALDFAEHAWRELEPMMKTALCQSMNEPIANDSYDEGLAYLEGMIPMYEEAIAQAQTAGEADSLRAEMEQMQVIVDDYRENGAWIVSEKSIAEYRAFEAQMVPAQPDFWSVAEEDQAVLQYLDGMLSADRYIEQLLYALRMTQLESY